MRNNSVKDNRLVKIEIMPEWLISSHKKAGNWGIYPLNGAERIMVDEDEVEDYLLGCEYNHIVD